MPQSTERSLAMPAGDAEYRLLTDALADTNPPCANDPRFILDPQDIAPDELSYLALTICRTCPLKALCRDYASTARPDSGVWAGRTWARGRANTDQETNR